MQAVDYLGTVSGGGYCGSAYLTHLRGMAPEVGQHCRVLHEVEQHCQVLHAGTTNLCAQPNAKQIALQPLQPTQQQSMPVQYCVL